MQLLVKFTARRVFPTTALAWKTVLQKDLFCVIGNLENEIIANDVDTSNTKLHKLAYQTNKLIVHGSLLSLYESAN